MNSKSKILISYLLLICALVIGLLWKNSQISLSGKQSVISQEQTLAECLEAFKNHPKDYRKALIAFEKIEKIGPDAIPFLLEALEKEDPLTKTHILTALGIIGKDSAPVRSKLIEELDNPNQDWTRSLSASNALAKIGKNSVPILREKFKTASPYAQTFISNAFYRLGRKALPAIDEVSQLSESQDTLTKRGAIAALGAMGPEAISALPLLHKNLKDSDPQIQRDSAYAIWQIKENDPKALEVIFTILDSHNLYLRPFSAWALAQYSNQQLHQALVRYYRTPQKRARELNIPFTQEESFFEFGETLPLDQLISDLRSNQKVLITYALTALRFRKEQGIPALGDIYKQTNYPDFKIQLLAIRALYSISPKSPISLKAFRKLVKSPDMDVRHETAMGILRSETSAIPILEMLIEDKDRSYAFGGSLFFSELRAEANEKLREVITSNDDNYEKKYYAIFAVALTGKEALPLKPDIEKLLKTLSAKNLDQKDLTDISKIALKRISEN